MRSFGIVQRAAFSSISAQRAPLDSPERVAVRISHSKASLVICSELQARRVLRKAGHVGVRQGAEMLDVDVTDA